MSKLYFRYGTVSSAKTANLLIVYHNYLIQGKKALLIKPAVDDRKGENIVYSRVGLTQEADIVLKRDDNLSSYFTLFRDVYCIICDEAQFFTKSQITELREIATTMSIPVICYGLKTDYKGNLFEGSERLLCLADSIEEIKTICYYCNKKAIMNLKINSKGEKVCQGDDKPDVGFEDKYLPTCYKHYSK